MYSLFNQFLFLLLDRFSIDLDKSRELEVGIYWRDWRSLCAIKFLRLEEFIDDIRHGMALQLEPQGLLFAEVISLLPSEFAEILRTVLLFFFLVFAFFSPCRFCCHCPLSSDQIPESYDLPEA